MTAVSGDLLTTRNATIDDLVVLLRDQQARKVDVVASASSVRAEGGCLVLDGTMPLLGADGVTMTAGPVPADRRVRCGDRRQARHPGRLPAQDARLPPGAVRRERERVAGAGRPEVLHPRPARLRRGDRGRPGLAVGRVQEDRPPRHADGRLRRHPPGRAPGPDRDLRPDRPADVRPGPLRGRPGARARAAGRVPVAVHRGIRGGQPAGVRRVRRHQLRDRLRRRPPSPRGSSPRSAPTG